MVERYDVVIIGSGSGSGADGGDSFASWKSAKRRDPDVMSVGKIGMCSVCTGRNVIARRFPSVQSTS
jgi:hypothetical protein